MVQAFASLYSSAFQLCEGRDQMHFALASETEVYVQLRVYGNWLQRPLHAVHWGAVLQGHGLPFNCLI